ncbi:neuropeptide Y receptor type 6-like [Clytia hemisphaerica]|uniref:neuropeptide Y receptor type 6-like n=1 Tax=Clytia hemisphaerica TaxID=252671 RepID=UPI0034D54C95
MWTMNHSTLAPTIMTRINQPIRISPFNLVTMSLLVAIMIIGCFGNSVIIYVFAYKRREQIKRFERFLLLLAVVDLTASLVIPSSFFYLTATDFRRWDFGETGCRIIPSLLQMSITISHGVLILISYERYHTLVKPFNPRIGRPIILVWLLFFVFLSIGLMFPYMKTLTIIVNEHYQIKTCMPDAQRISLLMLSSSLQVLRDIFAIGIMAILNQRMNHALTKQQRDLTWKREKMSRKGRALLRRVIVIFSGLTLPVDIFQAVFYSLVFAGVPLSKTSFKVLSHINTLLNILQMGNSMVNIFIYSRMHDMFQLQWCRATTRSNAHRRRITQSEYLPNDTEALTKSYGSSREGSYDF